MLSIESKSLFATHGGSLVFLTYDEVEIIFGEKECELCGGKDVSLRAITFEDLKKVTHQYHKLNICRSCSVEILEKKDFDFTWNPKPKFLDVDEMWDRVPKDEDDLASKLKKSHPEFVKKFGGFLDDEVTYDDGTKHELLQSIADQVCKRGKYPSEKQIRAFSKVYDALKYQKDALGVLKKETEEDRAKRKKTCKYILDLLQEDWHIRHLTPKTKDIIHSMADQFDTKGRLTIKQLELLRSIADDLAEKGLLKSS